VEIVDYHQEIKMTIQREALNSTKWGNVVSGEKLAPVHPGELPKLNWVTRLITR